MTLIGSKIIKESKKKWFYNSKIINKEKLYSNKELLKKKASPNR